MSSKRRKNPIKKSTIIKIVIGVVVLLAIILVGIKLLQSKVKSKFANNEETGIESATVTVGSISTTVSGSGTLSYEDSEDITLPATVEVTEYFVSQGNAVSEGDLLASVNTTSLIAAMSDIQEEIAKIDEELAKVTDETVSDTIKATVAGRIKVIYAEKDREVSSIMYDNDALMLLSLDGKMSVDVTTDALTEGDSVTVASNDSSYDGIVEKVVAGVATITLTDDGPTYDADAVVSKDDSEIGSGKLYIHKELAVTGYAGTISGISVSENQKVTVGTKLISLTNTSYTANYDSLLKSRDELQTKLQNLLTIYKEGAVYAKNSGTIVSLTQGVAPDTSTSTNTMMGSTEDTGTDTVFSISPDTNMNITVSVDETKILSLVVGQEATVTIDSLGSANFTGSVTEISTEGSSSNGVTSYSCIVTIPKSSDMLSGMSADVSIMIEGTENAILVPVSAVNKTSSTAYVYTSYDEENDTLGDMVEVTIGLSNNQYIEITSGLKEGDTVYYKPAAENQIDFSNFGGFGGNSDFGGFGGDMPNMPSGGSGGMPSFGGGSGDFNGGGGKPNFGGGN